MLLNNTWRPRSNPGMSLLLDMMEQVVTETYVYELCCTEDPEAARLSYTVMKGA